MAKIHRSINWGMTAVKITELLNRKATTTVLSEFFQETDRTMRNKLSGKRIDVETLAGIASLLGCSMDDLLDFDTEDCQQLERLKEERDAEDGRKWRLSGDGTVEALAHHVEANMGLPIRSLREFILYLHLYPQCWLSDFLWRVSNRLGVVDTDYFNYQLKQLYEHIEDSPAKKYADEYRDNVLRANVMYEAELFMSQEMSYDLMEDYLQSIRDYDKCARGIENVRQLFDDSNSNRGDGD